MAIRCRFFEMVDEFHRAFDALLDFFGQRNATLSKREGHLIDQVIEPTTCILFPSMASHLECCMVTSNTSP